MAQVRSQNVIQIAVEHLHEDVPVVNVWHVFGDEVGSQTDEAIVNAFADRYQTWIMPQLTNNVTLERFTWVSLDPDDTAAGEHLPDPALPDVGEVTGSSLPPNNAALVHKRTPNRPRGRRDGRAFLAGIREADIDTFGRWSAPALLTWNNALSNFWDDFDNPGVDPFGEGNARRWIVVLETTEESRAPGNDEVIIASRRVTSLVMDPVIATQRDRLR